MPRDQQLLASTSAQELLSDGYLCSLAESVDHNRLKQDYPWVELIGLVGFDTKRQKFVLVA